MVRRATSPSPAWAGDPPEDDGEARRRIRDAARRCMDRQGVNVRIAEVARELGVSRPTVYRHYPSSERLLVAVAADSIGPLLERIQTAVEGFGGTLGDMIVEQTALLLELLPQEPYLGLLLTSGSAGVFAKRMTNDAAMSLGRQFVHRLPIDWDAHGYDDEALDQLVEITTRLVQSFMLDPGDRPRTGAELRRFLRRWVGTAVDAAPAGAPGRPAPRAEALVTGTRSSAQSVCLHTDCAAAQARRGPEKGGEGDAIEGAVPAMRVPPASPGAAQDEALSQLATFVQFVSRPALGPRRRRRVAVAARTPVTESETSALQAMGRYGCRSVNELAARLGLERSTVSRLVGRLTELGLVARETSAVDRRRVRIGLTDTGRHIVAVLEQVARNDLEVATAHWSPADRRALGALVGRLRHDLERLRFDENGRPVGLGPAADPRGPGTDP